MTSLELPSVHITDVTTFVGCRAKWHWSSPLRMSLTTREPNKHLWLGRVVHHALAAYYGTPKRSVETLRSAYMAEVKRTLSQTKQELGYVPEDIQEYAILGMNVLKHYALWAPQNDMFDVIMPEVPLKLEVADGNGENAWVFSGQTDGLVRDQRGDLWLLEHKTSSRIPSERLVSMAWQGAAYTWAARHDEAVASVGRVRGVLYNFVLKAPPTKPQTLVSGGLARRANLRSTPEAFMAEVRAQGLDPDDYVDYAAKLASNRGNFFRRYLITYTDEHLELFELRLRAVAEEMIGNPFIYPQDSFRVCPGCEFSELCRTAFSGLSYDDVLATFVRSTYYQEADAEGGEA